MSRTLVPFTEGHLDEAAELLARRHAAERSRRSLLPERFTSPAAARTLLEAVRPRSNGVTAIEHGRIIGYLLGRPDLDWGTRSRLVPMEGHAVEHEDAVEVYREMYAAASPAWNDEGFFHHTVNIAAGDAVAAEAFVSLGFGRMLAFGLRDTSHHRSLSPDIRVERARPEQIDEVRALMLGLGKYNSSSPLYRPYVPSGGDEWPRRPLVLQQMASETCSYWLAYQSGSPAGVMVFTPPEATEAMVSPEDAVYLWIAYVAPDARGGGVGHALLARGLEWARQQGHGHCTVGWFTTNLSGARFWTARGYDPVMYRLERRLDERIAWAKASG